MGLRRQLNADGIAHSNADSLTHITHCLHRKEKRLVEWVPESAPHDSPSEIFKLRRDGLEINNGYYYVGSPECEEQVEGAAFENHLSAANWQRRWNYGQMKRGDKICTVRRKRKQPAIGETVVNLAPYQMTFLNSELERWENAGISSEKRTEMFLALLEPLRKAVVTTFKEQTGWDVVASYCHTDSNKVHFGVIRTSVTADNQLVWAANQNADRYLRTIGPWSTAVWRQKMIGACDASDTRLQQNLDKFHKRHGTDKVPLDICLHEAVDGAFDSVVKTIGGDAEKRFDAAKSHYREWKVKARREAVIRSPGSQRISWDVLRLITPLLPPQVQATISLARTACQAFQVVTTALDTLAEPNPTRIRTPHEITKTL